MNKFLYVVLVLSTFGWCHSVWGYEILTHERMSHEAAMDSVLSKSDGKVLTDLGLKFSITDDRQQFPNFNGEQRNIRDLIGDGARFEDGLTNDCESRPRNHFLDPLYNRPLTVLGIAISEKSPDWALEDLENMGSQAFSFRHARDYLYKALTLPSEQDRKKNFGLTFQTLGHVIHHIQDMAQPQHVRNDIHIKVSENCWYKTIAKLIENPSLYEHYTDDHRGELPFGGGAVQLPNPRAFWTNDSGTGLAQFTNRNFVSAGTNFQMRDGQVAANSTYPNPEPTSETSIDVQQLFADEKLPPPRDQDGNLLQGDIIFIGSNVDGAPNLRASTLSIFDQDLEAYDKEAEYRLENGQVVAVKKVFTLNRFNFQAAYPFLIPKAVGYSAGMIDYFFRGAIDMDIDYDSTTGGQYLIMNQWQEDMKGTFTLYYDAVDGKRYPVKGDTNDLTWRDVVISGNGKSISLIPPFLPSSPKPKRPDEYILVFNGQMGEEKPLDTQSVGAVVAKTKLRLLWESWREQLIDNHPWVAREGDVNGKVGPNSQTLQNGHLVEYAGVGGAGWVEWRAKSSDDFISGRYLKIRLNCSESAATENWNVYGFLSVGPSSLRSQTIPFAGGAGTLDSSPYKLVPRPTSKQEYIIDLGGLGNQIGYLDIVTIGFDMELTCSVDYLDFSDEPFEKVADGVVFIP
jgi:hypothetical protein